MQITWREIGGWNDVRVYHGVDDTEIIPIFIVWGKGEDFDWYVHDLVGWGKGEAVEVVIPKIPESFVSFTYKDAISLAHDLIDEYLVRQYVHAQEVVE